MSVGVRVRIGVRVWVMLRLRLRPKLRLRLRLRLGVDLDESTLDAFMSPSLYSRSVCAGASAWLLGDWERRDTNETDLGFAIDVLIF